MIVVAGPPGAGKSTAFPVASFGVDSFNADDRAAELNGGSYWRIADRVRQQVNREFEAFVAGHIRDGESFAFETTLRSPITFEQAERAKAAGFRVEMRYLALESFALHLMRVKSRADRGGHSAPEAVLRSIHRASLGHLARAIWEVDLVRVYDNTGWGTAPVLVLEANGGRVVYQRASPPAWMGL